jgi:hypothetical protein
LKTTEVAHIVVQLSSCLSIDHVLILLKNGLCCISAFFSQTHPVTLLKSVMKNYEIKNKPKSGLDCILVIFWRLGRFLAIWAIFSRTRPVTYIAVKSVTKNREIT